MAAVVASLAAFLTGCGLPGLPSSLVARDHPSGQERELGGGGADCQIGTASATEWGSTWQPTGSLDLAAALVKALMRRSNDACNVVRPMQFAPPTPAQCSLALAGGVVGGSHHLPVPTVATATGSLTGVHRSRRPLSISKRVHFDLSKTTEHEITPYSEVYELHPRDFNFARGRYAPTACFVDPRPALRGGCSSDSSDDDDDDDGTDHRVFRLAGRRWRMQSGIALVGKRRQLPQHLWYAGCVLCFLVRVFGTEILWEPCPK